MYPQGLDLSHDRPNHAKQPHLQEYIRNYGGNRSQKIGQIHHEFTKPTRSITDPPKWHQHPPNGCGTNDDKVGYWNSYYRSQGRNTRKNNVNNQKVLTTATFTNRFEEIM